ncbi:MAG: NACHT domain-containing protein [Candidatus Hodarchaeota archaeon]
MLDWLAVWGVTQAVGFVFKPVMEELATDTIKDWVGDYFKKSFKNVLHWPEKKPLEVAVGKALREFLVLVQQELEDADVDERTLKEYTKPLQQFLKTDSVRGTLGSAFEIDRKYLDITTLANSWKDLALKDLPDEFNWEQVAKRYLRKVKAIRQESDELRQILDFQAKQETVNSIKELVGVSLEFDLVKYREGVQEHYGHLRLESLDTSGYEYIDLKLWRMFIPQNVRECHEYLPQIYELPKEIQHRLKADGHLEEQISLEELERYREIYAEQPIRQVLETIDEQQFDYLVILGDPGSGKSTLLQYLVLNWAENPISNLPLYPLPLLIELRTYIRNRDSGMCHNFLEFFHKAGSGFICPLNQHYLHEWLKKGNALVMFDGLDEIFDLGKREDIITDIIRFTNDYPKTRVIVTSRVVGYKPRRLRDAGFYHFILQDLDDSQINNFLFRWHDLTYNNETERVRKQKRLNRAINTYPAIRELAGNPLLLTMLAILNRHQELPRDRAELYNQASRVLLHQWDVERHLLESRQIEVKTIDYKDKQAMLRLIAYHMQAHEKGLAGNSIRANDLEIILTNYLKTMDFGNPRAIARLMVEQLRTRNFILCYLGADYYAFVHRTFLEYFCAWEFVWQFKERQSLSIEQLKSNVYGEHWQDESWHEVLRLVAGMLDAKFVGEIIDFLIQENAERDDFKNIFLAAKCLSEIRNRHGIEAPTQRLLVCLKNLIEYGDYTLAVERLETKGDVAESARIRKIRSQAIAMIVTNWKNDSAILSWLKSLTQEDKASHDEGYWMLQHNIVSELAKGGRDSPEILAWLKSSVQHNTNGPVREAALQELARGWRDDPDILPMLKRYIREDDHQFTRYAAVRELAKGWKDDIDTLPLLKERALIDEDYHVRRGAIKELAQGWYDSPEMFDIFYKCITEDPFRRWYSTQENHRQIALETIIKYYRSHPKTYPLLQSLAADEPDSQIRQIASEGLEKFCL